MIRDFLTALLAVTLVTHATPPAPQAPSSNATGNETPLAASGNVTSRDPAAVVFTTAAGVVLHAVKPAATADYEAAIVALQEALARAEEPETRRVAASWRVYKATEPDAKGSVIYLHYLSPALPDVDYRPSLWLDELLAGAPADLLAKYRDAFAVPPTKLSLTEFADMAVVPPPRPSNATPGNVTPGHAAPSNLTPPGPPRAESPSAQRVWADRLPASG